MEHENDYAVYSVVHVCANVLRTYVDVTLLDGLET